MSVVAKAQTKPVLAGQRFVLWDVGWDGYQALLKIAGDRPIRVTYDRGSVELNSPLPKRERRKSLFGQIVRILAAELGIPVLPVGSTTLSREGVDRGLEPDEGFYLGNLERIRDPDEIDLDIDPPPDLAVEITKSALDRLGIYGALGVPEFWRFDGRSLRVLLRQQDGSYREAASSAAFPGVPMDEIARLAAAAEGIRDENEWCDRFRMWVRGVVLPRLQAGDGD